ncbi:MAG: efflux RND transporter periplasmic adaptor subunit [Candidatus Eisenbacteria bacterium]|uniref:Efflux RND transporter periplasmic adaptor subunit n=1 Tax=Eiseniibacteriota bacterium TaxID=2212470 RepID=A0A538T998_UNCEI|nr:MAG: efflux RND transporter periplasmic adaptor subunit [Candidatus Eisenbacteria bacterium]
MASVGRAEKPVGLRRAAQRPLVLALVALASIAAILLVRGARHRSGAQEVLAVPVERRDIAVTIEATGAVEPIDLVEVKSKASGQIVRMPVQVGSTVRRGDLLAQIDPRDVQNQYSQSLAALDAARAKAEISGTQKKRSDDLFATQVITAEEHESAILDYANAQAALVKAAADLDLAKQRREDATVRAPIGGTILDQAVSSGQVISSATSSASGGTTLLHMADLAKIRLRALVGETDIGSVRPGQTATVTVDAFPQRTFTGRVEKIEPQAVVQQSVTMFPVLISVSNESRLLLPGMNGEVSMLVDQRENVPAIPVDAVRGAREMPVVAAALGLDAARVRAQVDEQLRPRAAGRATRSGASDSSPGRGFRAAAQGTRAGGAGRASRAQVAFVKTAAGLEPRVVRLGLSDFDYAEVLDGVEAGEQVVLLGVAEAQASRAETQNRIRQRLGSGVPGVPGTGGGSARGGGPGGGRGGPGGGP